MSNEAKMKVEPLMPIVVLTYEGAYAMTIKVPATAVPKMIYIGAEWKDEAKNGDVPVLEQRIYEFGLINVQRPPPPGQLLRAAVKAVSTLVYLGTGRWWKDGEQPGEIAVATQVPRILRE